MKILPKEIGYWFVFFEEIYLMAFNISRTRNSGYLEFRCRRI